MVSPCHGPVGRNWKERRRRRGRRQEPRGAARGRPANLICHIESPDLQNERLTGQELLLVLPEVEGGHRAPWEVPCLPTGVQVKRPLKVTQASLSADGWVKRSGGRGIPEGPHKWGCTLGHSRLHSSEPALPNLCQGPRLWAAGSSAARGAEDAPQAEPVHRGSLGCGQLASGGGPPDPLAPTAPSPTALFPAHPVPSDASDVTANNLDFNQEITPPLPAPIMV